MELLIGILVALIIYYHATDRPCCARCGHGRHTHRSFSCGGTSAIGSVIHGGAVGPCGCQGYLDKKPAPPDDDDYWPFSGDSDRYGS
jgi:hypothetical protein